MTSWLCQCLTSLPSLAAWEPGQGGSVYGGTHTCMGKGQEGPWGCCLGCAQELVPQLWLSSVSESQSMAHTPSAALLLPEKVRHPGLAFR